MQRLTLKKKIISNATGDEMGKILGGYGETDDGCLFDSRICLTYFNTGGCTPSESCQPVICIPHSDLCSLIPKNCQEPTTATVSYYDC